MDAEKIFVGRKVELERFKKVLEEPKGQAVLVVGQAGMGKTWLVNEITQRAEKDDMLKCCCPRYEVTPTDPANTVMAEIMNDAADAIDSLRNKTKKFIGQNKQKLAALFGVGGLIPVVGSRIKAVGDLVISLTERDKAGNVRKQFIDVLKKLSENMPDKGRAVFVIDPEKYMQEKSDYAWGLVIDRIPEKIKFVFPQRPGDVLIKGEGLKRCNNIVRIPEGELEKFDEENIKELVNTRSERIPELKEEMQISAQRSDKSPYAVTGTLELIASAGMNAEDLAQYLSQEEVARAQWRGICDKGDEAKQLFEGYAVLEVGVPDDIVQTVSGLSTTARKRLQKDGYLKGLLREEGEGKRIYHSILADYISGQMSEAEKKAYHGRAAGVYRAKLAKARAEQIKPDALAAMRLAGHVLEAEGKGAFVDAFVNECFGPLKMLGLLDAAIGLSERALGIAEKDSKEEAMVLGNLGLIYMDRGELDKAGEMHLKSLGIEKKLGRLEGMASDYGNLGLIYSTRGELDKAEEMYFKSLEIEKKIGRLEGMASEYGNLGGIYYTKGDLDKAEEMFRDGLKIYEKLGRLEGMASEYGNLGVIYRSRGDLDKAEEMFKKILKIHEDIGHKEGMANDYGNLGLIYSTRGELDKAEEMHLKSLEINKKLGRLEGMAREYGNLGGIYMVRGELDKAEKMYKKSLEISESRGMMELTANQYGNLGNIYLLRSNLIKAEKMYRKVLEIEEKLERPDSIALAYGNLGLIYSRKGELDKAEEMHSKSLEIEKKLGRLEGMAREYGNLGLIYKDKRELDKAEKMFKKILKIHEDIGHKEGMARDYDNLGMIYEERGDNDKAKKYGGKALEFFKKIGMPHMVKKVEGWIEGIGKKKKL